MKRTPIRPGQPLRRKARMRPRNPERRAAEHARTYGDHATWIRSLPCVVLVCRNQHAIEAAHTANGGMGRKADARTIVPLCTYHHQALHTLGRQTFERMHRIDLQALAASLWKRSPVRCQECEGSGQIVVDMTADSMAGPGDPIFDDCPVCDGTGQNDWGPVI